MIIILLLSMLITGGITYPLLSDFNKPIRWVISFSISFVLYSILYFYILMFRLDFNTSIIIFFILNLAVVFIRYKKLRTIIDVKHNPDKKSLFFLILLMYALIIFIRWASVWGYWDAWAIWSMHAKFLFYNTLWKSLFTNQIAWTHPDYPLMLPSAIALFWKSIGKITPVIPFLISILPFVGILFLMYYSFENQFISILSLLLIFLNFNFLYHSASQIAGTLLSFFYLLTIILIYWLQNKTSAQKERIFLFIGFAASAGLWVKNEGIVFFVFTTLILLIKYFKSNRLLIRYITGALLVLVTFGLFKVLYAPVNDLIARQSGHTIDKILNPHRYVTIVIYLMRTIAAKYPVIPVLLLFILWSKPKILISTPFLIIGLTFMAYLSVYVITPYNLLWHLKASLDRLIGQLYPAFIFLFFKELTPIKHFSKQDLQPGLNNPG